MINKLVKESLSNTFSRGGDDKISSLGIGKITLIKNWLEEREIWEYTIDENFTIDIKTGLGFNNLEVDTKFPDYIQFGTVHGNFVVGKCNLKTLRGCPHTVIGSFFCETNNLKSLEYAPKTISGSLYCANNKIPEEDIIKYERSGAVSRIIRSDFDKWVPSMRTDESFTKNNKTKLEGLGLGKKALIRKWLEDYKIFNYKINDDLSIDVKGNVEIVDKEIEELPDYIQFNDVVGNFKIKFCELTSLKGFPNRVTKSCSCAGNKLESLEYCPKFIGRAFFCDENLLKDLKYTPENVGEEMFISRNQISLNDILITKNKKNFKIISYDYKETN